MRDRLAALRCLWENVGGEMKGIGVEKANAEKSNMRERETPRARENVKDTNKRWFKK